MKEVAATMAGTVIQVLVNEGDEVQVGQDVVMLESMKMEVPVAAESAGKVTKIKVGPGDFVNEGDALLELE
ncbi:acetyl-CoA carboxylase biotin carboxyl carrier protein subunit [Aneurinibacillus sp. Ricciae_BoGa-3]|uniref:acetyl-CoA carboxylase biotin carboxyl carrier protein subunit n=1 Tax=Aneurinibacillus sp. Ricciae_BoGa-3 TaxID=3022697 RepID=UPI00234018BF|nr:acetyl-CoA carboxylase biotin carboxyl carrier protein subunit [Aneurinibacillus sp. Ricciae_BoGa-3]WCK53099.1 acetyl-CoA carboxylase biotin carboxyl carrier protein subunit [Aneurinibacillus sp. Ricciae_BoGa-3]